MTPPRASAAQAALVIGASGGIGAALADALEARGYAAVHRLSRRGAPPLDLERPETIAAALDDALSGPPITTAFVATGLLHDGALGPEKALRDLDPGWLSRQFAVNAIGPALLLATLLPALPRDRPVRVGVLGARVGSISDNRLGGWYGYRASKAALHQIVRSAAIEWARSHRQGVLVALHPGTVATALSAPFARATPTKPLLTPAASAAALLAALDALAPSDSGRIFGPDGAEIAP